MVKSGGKFLFAWPVMLKSFNISPILSFWFGDPQAPDYGAPRTFWFQSTPHLDREIRDQFEDLHRKAAKGELDMLMESPEGSLALILLLDQFPRNMYRGTPQAFASDAKALEIAKHALEKRFDQSLLPVHKMFLYLPFEHSENVEDQENSVALFKTLGNDEGLEYALQHRDIIARFGRFPHRNEILGRKSTPDELNFLKEPGTDGFGQVLPK